MKEKFDKFKENYLLVNNDGENYEKLKVNIEKTVHRINKIAFLVLAIFVTLVALKMFADTLSKDKEMRAMIGQIRDTAFYIAFALFISNLIIKIRLIILNKLKK